MAADPYIFADLAEMSAKADREAEASRREAVRVRRGIAEGRIKIVPPTNPSDEFRASPTVVADERFKDFYDLLRHQGESHESAHSRAVNRAEQEAEMRAKGYTGFDRLRRSAPGSVIPFTRSPAKNDNKKPRINASPFALDDPATLSRREWLLGKFALRKEISMTVAPGGVGKTALSHAEAISLASGRAFLGFDVPSPLRVWVWNGEEPMEEMKRRIGAICLHHDVSADDLDDRLFVDTEDDVKLVLCVQDRTKAEVMVPVVDALVAELKERKIDVMIVDPFVSTHNCTENDNGAMHAAASAWKTVAKQANCAVHLVHHTRKANGQTITSESLRGGDAVSSKARMVRPLNPLSAKDAKKRNISPREATSIFWYDPAGSKVNMTARGSGVEWYKIVSVPLFNQTTGNLDVGDEIGVVTRYEPPPEIATMGLADDDLSAFKAELAIGFYPCAPQAHGNPAWVGHLIARCFHLTVDTNSDWKRRANAIWKQLLGEVEVIESPERDDRHQMKKVGRPAPEVGEQVEWTPPADAQDEL